MKKIKRTFEITEYASEAELNPEDSGIIRDAKEAIKTAYAPYSRFKVGAAVLLANGKIIKGSNQENAAYPSGLCAERVALFSAGASFPGVAVRSIAVAVNPAGVKAKEPVAPCGACRQVMAEFESLSDKKIRIFMSGNSGRVFMVESVEDLLPFGFGKDSL